MATWDDVHRLVLAMPETEERSPGNWRVKGRPLCWERPLRKSDVAALEALGAEVPEGAILGARVPDEGAKLALIADDPAVYFTTPHFDGYPAILVKLDAIGVPELTELIVEAWLAQAPKTLAKRYLADHPPRGDA